MPGRVRVPLSLSLNPPDLGIGPTSVPRRARRPQVARPCKYSILSLSRPFLFTFPHSLPCVESRVPQLPLARQTRPSASPFPLPRPLGSPADATKYARPRNPPTDVAFVARPLATWAAVWTSSPFALSLPIHSFNRSLFVPTPHSYEDLGFPLSILGFPLIS